MISADADLLDAIAADATSSSLSSVPVLWITGLSGVGKSTLARRLMDALASSDSPPMLLDGDTIRLHGDAELRDRHDLASRRRRAWRIAQLAHEVALRSQPVIVATISLFRDVQAWNRRHHSHFAEIVIDAPIDLLRQRYPQRYGAEGEARPINVWGIDQVPEFPERAELSLRQDFAATSLSDHLAQTMSLWQKLVVSAKNSR
jgi:adenylylsulfate kinase-like enzyme